jgi:hypothetical protein
MTTASPPVRRQIFDPKSGKLRLADETGALPPVATVEAMIGKINDLLQLFGFDPMPNDTNEETVMARLQSLIDTLAERERSAAQEEVQAIAAANRLRTLCGLPRVPLTSRVSAAILPCCKVVEAIPVVKARGKMLAAQLR